MPQVRCILASNESGSIETLYFTMDLESPADDFIRPDCKLSGETTLDEYDLPDAFPLEYTFVKS